MQQTRPTTPFGRRPLSLAMAAAQVAANACPPEAVAHKWRLFRSITEAKNALGVSDRALAVLSALLSFHQETTLTAGPDLIVFPSNRELSLRSHGMAPATLRRHLAALVEAGLIIRRDSPNGKRYARKGEGGAFEVAFGFDLSPLVARMNEFERLAEEARADARARYLLREEISLQRRDIAKTIQMALDEKLSGPWLAFAEQLRAIGGAPPRSAERGVLEQLVEALRALRVDVDKCLSEHLKNKNPSANESHDERHYQNSNPEPPDSEPGLQGRPGGAVLSEAELPHSGQRPFPLGMVLDACPDIIHYARNGISSWRDFLATAALVRPILGISPDAWKQACDAMGETNASVLIAAILQRAEAIKSPGGYLRALTDKARTGQFSLGPVLMALLRGRNGIKKQA